MAIDAKTVAQLREKTGAGMMDCKKALTETNGDVDAAVDFLRKKGLATASKKAGRVAAEGLIAVNVDGNKGSMLEINIETDFAAKNDKFQALAENLVKDFSNFDGTDMEAFGKSPYSVSSKPIEEEIVSHIATIGENISLRRGAKLSVDTGAVVSYVHGAVKPGMGKIGVLVALESGADNAELQAIGKQIAMHVAAAKPEALNVEDLDPALVERERALLIEQAKASGKPENVIEKMVEGRLVKFYEQSVLTQQLFVIDGKTRISDFLEQEGKRLGSEIKITGYVRYELGEGIEKKEENFAKEVAEAMGSA